MSLEKANCNVQHQEMIIKRETVEDDEFDDSDSSGIFPKFKCENGQNDPSWHHQSSELDNLENTISPCIKNEPEDIEDGFHQVQPEYVELKGEDIDLEEHKSGWNLIGRNSNVGTFNNELVDLLNTNQKLKCENGRDVTSCVQSPESTRDDVHALQAEDVEFKVKEEEIIIKEHVPGWKLIGSSNVGVFKDGLDQCDSSEQNVMNLSGESKTEGRAKYTICSYCPYKTNRKYDYVKHYNRKHKQGTQLYECNECPYKSGHKYDFVKHEQKHSRAQVYKIKCDECSYKTNDKSHFTRHYKSKHAKDAEVYKCEDCSFETKNKSHLIQHYKRKHLKETAVYKCDECSFATKNRSLFTRHCKCKHSKDVYKCQECSYETRAKEYLTRHHELKHSKSKVYRCGECSYEGRNKRYLAQHYRRRHTKERKCKL